MCFVSKSKQKCLKVFYFLIAIKHVLKDFKCLQVWDAKSFSLNLNIWVMCEMML